MRLRGQAGSRKEDIVATLGRLSQFHDSLQTSTDKIDELVDAVARKLSQPIADDVQEIQRDQQLFEVRSTCVHLLYLTFSLVSQHFIRDYSQHLMTVET